MANFKSVAYVHKRCRSKYNVPVLFAFSPEQCCHHWFDLYTYSLYPCDMNNCKLHKILAIHLHRQDFNNRRMFYTSIPHSSYFHALCRNEASTIKQVHPLDEILCGAYFSGISSICKHNVGTAG